MNFEYSKNCRPINQVLLCLDEYNQLKSDLAFFKEQNLRFTELLDEKTLCGKFTLELDNYFGHRIYTNSEVIKNLSSRIEELEDRVEYHFKNRKKWYHFF